MMFPERRVWYAVAAAALLILIAAGIFYLHDSRQIHECVSELHTSKTAPDGSNVALNLTAVLIFHRTDSLNAIYKGRLTTPQGIYTLDRTWRLQLKSVNDSNIYQHVGRQMSKAPDDNAPEDIIDQLQLDNIDFFIITHLKDNAWLLHTLVFPAMVCKGR